VFLRWSLLAFVDLSAIDHQIVVVSDPVDADATECEVLKFHRTPPKPRAQCQSVPPFSKSRCRRDFCFRYPRCLAKIRASTTSTWWSEFSSWSVAHARAPRLRPFSHQSP